ncbi:MAG: Clp protease N-terminal domain-containing protein [Egibacteraceae bacterium]
MNLRAFQRLDESATHVLEVAVSEAIGHSDDAVLTEHLLLALATADPVTGRLLADSDADAVQLRRAIVSPRSTRPGGRQDHESLLATLGIDLAEVRRRAELTFGRETVARAAARVRRAPPRRPVWSWISCGMPLRGWTSESPLGGRRPLAIPRVIRILERAGRAAWPRAVSPADVLLALVTGQEPACEVLGALGVDLDALAAAARHAITQSA